MMKKESLLSCLPVLAIFAGTFAFVLSQVGPVYATTTTTTVTGWLFPDGTHFNNAIGAMLFPIVGVGIFIGIAKVTDSEGDFGVTLILAGLTIGGVLAQLSINGSNTNVLPFALILIPGADLIIWMWKGGG